MRSYDWTTIAKEDDFWCGVCETMDSREKLIEYIKNGDWLNEDWDKDNTMRVQMGEEASGYAMDGRLCLNRDENDFWIAIQIDKYSDEEDWHWGELNTEDTNSFFVGGKLSNIEEEISQDNYDNLAKELIKAVKNAYKR